MSGVTGLGAGCTVAEVFGLKLGPHRVNSAPMIYGRQYNNSNIFPFAMFQKQHLNSKFGVVAQVTQHKILACPSDHSAAYHAII